MSYFKKQKNISSVSVLLSSIFFVFLFFANVNDASAACTITQARFVPSSMQSGTWYNEDSNPEVTIEIFTSKDCEGQTIKLSVVADDLLNDHAIDILKDKELTFGTGKNIVSVKTTAGEDECNSEFTPDCQYYLEIETPDGEEWDFDGKPGGNLFYDCDGINCVGDNWGEPKITFYSDSDSGAPLLNADTNTTYKLLAPLPGIEPIIETSEAKNPCAFGKYLNILIKLVMGVAVVLAFVMIFAGGVEYIMSELVSSKESARSKINDAILGLFIALAAVLTLNTVNPDLLRACLKVPKLDITFEVFEIPAGFTFDGNPVQVKFADEAYPAAKFASEATGVEVAFILAIFGQETSNGANTGKCTYLNAQMKKEWLNDLIIIATELKQDYKKINMSCKSVGSNSGGAIGLSQFIPPTWNEHKNTAKEIYANESLRAKITNEEKRLQVANPAYVMDPWDLYDALLMTAVFLKDKGGSGSDENNQLLAACRYFGTCYYDNGQPRTVRCGENEEGDQVYGTYGQCTLAKKASIEQQIKDLQGKGKLPK